MKNLEMSEMESLSGGVDCETGAGLAVGWAVGMTALTIATGGAILPLAILGTTLFPSFLGALMNCHVENQ
jgi:hypothetical protein